MMSRVPIHIQNNELKGRSDKHTKTELHMHSPLLSSTRRMLHSDQDNNARGPEGPRQKVNTMYGTTTQMTTTMNICAARLQTDVYIDIHYKLHDLRAHYSQCIHNNDRYVYSEHVNGSALRKQIQNVYSQGRPTRQPRC